MSAVQMIGYPRGWFVIAWSTDLEPRGVKPLKYFGQHLVLFRGESGDVALLDAFCPHLGAHLGHGGRVEGESVRCPFHAWEFDGGGACTRIPYSERAIPDRARVRPWSVVEKNGAIFAWHDPEGAAPDWDVPDIAEHGSDAWTPWYPNTLFNVKTHPREIVENVADKAHFPTVHRTDVSTFENIYDGHRATQHTIGTATPPQGGIDHFDITATYHGPAFQISDMKGVLHSRLLLAHTPIDEEHLDLRFAVMLERSGPRTETFAQFYVDNLRLGFHEDIAIWENKVFREKPHIVSGDGPIGRLRTWYRQFYRPRAGA
jgi:3-ketosteroid 9alpha-monooxygenase subunit A